MLNERIKVLRKALNLTQEQFGCKIGFTSRTVYEWEKGQNFPKDKAFHLMESVFKVNPLWLREGRGEMFLAGSGEEITENIAEIVDWLKSLSPLDRIWIRRDMEYKYDLFRQWLKNQNK